MRSTRRSQTNISRGLSREKTIDLKKKGPCLSSHRPRPFSVAGAPSINFKWTTSTSYKSTKRRFIRLCQVGIRRTSISTASGRTTLRQMLQSHAPVLRRFDDPSPVPPSRLPTLSCSTTPFSTKRWLASLPVKGLESRNLPFGRQNIRWRGGSGL